MKICFFALGSLPIHASSLEERPLGGTETGLIRVADILARKGHQVVVVTSHPDPLPFNLQGGPLYVPPQILGQFGGFDCFVAVQFWRSLLENIPARKRFFWTGDGKEQFSNLGIGDPRVFNRVSKVFCASNWHRETLCAASGIPLEKAVVVGNGIYLPYFSDEVASRIERESNRVVYTSAPYRGLELAAGYFKKLHEQIADLEFHVYAGLSIYDRDGAYQGPHAARYEELKSALQKMPGVIIHGNVKQRELAEEYFRARIFLYPNTVDETFCITALEAQAAGCPVIASAVSALPETVGEGGIVIPGIPGSPEYSRAILAASLRLLTDDELWSQYSEAGRRRALSSMTWAHVAQLLEQELV